MGQIKPLKLAIRSPEEEKIFAREVAAPKTNLKPVSLKMRHILCSFVLLISILELLYCGNDEKLEKNGNNQKKQEIENQSEMPKNCSSNIQIVMKSKEESLKNEILNLLNQYKKKCNTSNGPLLHYKTNSLELYDKYGIASPHIESLKSDSFADNLSQIFSHYQKGSLNDDNFKRIVNELTEIKNILENQKTAITQKNIELKNEIDAKEKNIEQFKKNNGDQIEKTKKELNFLQSTIDDKQKSIQVLKECNEIDKKGFFENLELEYERLYKLQLNIQNAKYVNGNLKSQIKKLKKAKSKLEMNASENNTDKTNPNHSSDEKNQLKKLDDALNANQQEMNPNDKNGGDTEEKQIVQQPQEDTSISIPNNNVSCIQENGAPNTQEYKIVNQNSPSDPTNQQQQKKDSASEIPNE